MRLIDADALMDVIRQHEYRLATKQGSIDYGMFTLGIQQAVDEQPTVDAVPVVRCKDCKYYKESRVLAPNKFCFRLNHPTEPRKIGYNFGDDDFCSYGERRDKP